MLRRYQSGRVAIVGIAAAIGLAAVSSAGMTNQLGTEGMNFGIAPGQVDGLTVLMNQNFVQMHGFGAMSDGIDHQVVFAGNEFGQNNLSGQIGQHSFAGLGQLNRIFKGAGNGPRFFGHSSNSFHVNGGGQQIGNPGDGDAGIEGIPLPMSALLGLGGLIGMGLIRRYTR